jgi:hypothetical protein
VSASIDDPINFPLRMTVTAAVPDNGGAAITQYTWFRSANGGSFFPAGSTSGNVLVNDGNSGSSYNFKCWATNSIGNSDLSPVSNTVTLP